MANRNFPSNKLYQMHVMTVELDAQISIGASGAPAALNVQNAAGIQAITRLAAGIYRVQLQDNYNKLLKLDVDFQSPAPGSNVTAGAFVVGTPYIITALGNTNFASIGVPSSITPAIGVVFVATGVGAGTGTAKAITNSGVGAIEVMSSLMNNNNPTSNQGAYIIFQCLAPTSSSVTTSIPADPVNGSVMQLKIKLSNSAVQ